MPRGTGVAQKASSTKSRSVTSLAVGAKSRRSATKEPKTLLNRHEAALLAGVSISAVDKAIAQGVIKKSPRLKAHRETLLPRESVVALSVLGSAQRAGLNMSVKSKKQLASWLGENPVGRRRTAVLELAPAIVIRPDAEALDAAYRTGRYTEAREQWIEQNPRIFGGEPVITGTRITVHGVARRLEDGDTIETLLEDYPHLPREAFEVAATYAQTHPRRGRPVKPWRDRTAA